MFGVRNLVGRVSSELSDAMRLKEEAEELLREEVMRNSEEAAEKQKASYDAARINTDVFKVGTKVMVYFFPSIKLLSDKLRSFWKGPFVILKVCSPNLFSVKEVGTGKVFERISSTRLKLYNEMLNKDAGSLAEPAALKARNRDLPKKAIESSTGMASSSMEMSDDEKQELGGAADSPKRSVGRENGDMHVEKEKRVDISHDIGREEMKVASTPGTSFGLGPAAAGKEPLEMVPEVSSSSQLPVGLSTGTFDFVQGSSSAQPFDSSFANGTPVSSEQCEEKIPVQGPALKNSKAILGQNIKNIEGKVLKKSTKRVTFLLPDTSNMYQKSYKKRLGDARSSRDGGDVEERQL